MNVGYCKFCGQGMKIDTDYELMQEDLDVMATHKCECDQAQRKRYQEELMECAETVIEDVLEDETAEVRAEVMDLTALIATGKIMAAVIKSRSGNKVSIKMDSKMKIKYSVERKETRGAEV